MSLNELKSRAELSLFIESYWCYNRLSGEDLVLFPDGTFNVLISFERFHSVAENRYYPAGIYLCPIQKQPVHLETVNGMYGIRFKAFSLLNIIGSSKRQLTLLNDVQHFAQRSPALTQLQSHFLDHGSQPECYELLEEVAFELLAKNMNIHLSLRDKVNYILENKGNVRIEEMAKDFGVSRQALHKHFRQHLHITPKELAAIWQLNHFFTLNSEEETLTGLALDAGYYDQAHFINSFKLKFGMTPSQFIKSSPQLFSIAKESMEKRFNNYYDPEV